MSDSLDRVRGVQELPLFPLPVVLFPGAPMPLHIFEPRYLRMLEDIQLRDNLFGLSYFNDDASESPAPPVGHIGCVAEVTEIQPIPHGRSNILTVGLIRYRLDAYLEHGDPYLVGAVSFFEDDAEDEENLARNAQEVSTLFQRIALAVRIINDERANLPEIPDVDPEQLSFLVAAAMEIGTDTKLELLEMRSTSERLKRLRDLLARALPGYEERARMHSIAKSNGHAGKKIDLE
ncbi:MAG TPA: LON peptidase substrate-binding domain-containing protein [Pyrinomonadaceae bacterium]|nr:LON peptidase substrate-binding domain-containing protein [Pyrinomonadaceae bacterium]